MMRSHWRWMGPLTAILLACGGMSTPEPPPPSAIHTCQIVALTGSTTPIYATAQERDHLLGNLPVDTQVTLGASQGDWIQIVRLWHHEEDIAGWPVGWTPASHLTTNLKTTPLYGTDAVLMAGPDGSGPETAIPDPDNAKLSLLSCDGSSLEAKVVLKDGGVLSGWLMSQAHCPSADTPCS